MRPARRAKTKPPAPAAPRRTGKRWLQVALCAALVGAACSFVLWRLHLQHGGEAHIGQGCGVLPVGDCDSVLRSGYARLAGLPVALFGLGYFLALCTTIAWRLFAESTIMRWVLRCILAAGLAGSVWLTSIMAFRVGVCPVCLLAHSANLVAAIACWMQSRRVAVSAMADRGYRRLAVSVLLFAATLALLAFLHDPDADYSPEAISPGHADSQVSASLDSSSVEPANEQPLPEPMPPLWLSPSEGRHEVELFIDLTCAKCLKLSQTLEQIAQQHPGSIRIRLRLFPLEGDCNPTVERTLPEHKDSCRITSLALAVGEYRPEQFTEFHRLATADGPANLARAVAAAKKVLGPMAESFVKHESIQRRLDEDLNRGIDFGVNVLPTYVVSGRKYEGMPENEETLRRILEPLLRKTPNY
jgi:uncharacterized membrane protein/protein-disulfide isomerase